MSTTEKSGQSLPAQTGEKQSGESGSRPSREESLERRIVELEGSLGAAQEEGDLLEKRITELENLLDQEREALVEFRARAEELQAQTGERLQDLTSIRREFLYVLDAYLFACQQKGMNCGLWTIPPEFRMDDQEFLLLIDTDGGQVSWPILRDEAPFFSVKRLYKGDFDGHTHEQRYFRLDSAVGKNGRKGPDSGSNSDKPTLEIKEPE